MGFLGDSPQPKIVAKWLRTLLFYHSLGCGLCPHGSQWLLKLQSSDSPFRHHDRKRMVSSVLHSMKFYIHAFPVMLDITITSLQGGLGYKRSIFPQVAIYSVKNQEIQGFVRSLETEYQIKGKPSTGGVYYLMSKCLYLQRQTPFSLKTAHLKPDLYFLLY